MERNSFLCAPLQKSLLPEPQTVWSALSSFHLAFQAPPLSLETLDCPVLFYSTNIFKRIHLSAYLKKNQELTVWAFPSTNTCAEELIPMLLFWGAGGGWALESIVCLII